jgi:guanosine-3',5'-bis(diphosphate) 3'-pyrophosphohydrolase
MLYVESMNVIIQQVQEFARKAHGSQQRKFADEPYINHPIRVMEICRQFSQHVPVLAAALLHDVLEDTATTREQIHEFLSSIMNQKDTNETLQLVIALTDIYTKEAYPQWNRRKRKSKEVERLAATSPHAQTIKYADILDNTDIVHADTDFAPKFLDECFVLLQKMTTGNQALHQKVKDTVNGYRKELKNKSEDPKTRTNTGT